MSKKLNSLNTAELVFRTGLVVEDVTNCNVHYVVRMAKVQ